METTLTLTSQFTVKASSDRSGLQISEAEVMAQVKFVKWIIILTETAAMYTAAITYYCWLRDHFRYVSHIYCQYLSAIDQLLVYLQ